jgi:MFS family permease
MTEEVARAVAATAASAGSRSMSTTMPVGAGALLTHRAFLLFLLSRSLSRFSSLIAIVAFGWQVYDLTGSAFALGMIGLAGFLPTALLVFVAGNFADRYERKRILQACQFAEALTALLLAWGAFAGWLNEVDIFIAVLVLGTTAAFENPATAALLPLVVPEGAVQRATALSSGSAQLATITGPALGGIAYAISPGLPYAMMVVFWLIAAICAGAVRLTPSAASKVAATPEGSATPKKSATAGDLFAGVNFIRNHPAILGTLSLDLFAVLFGGVTALLPIYARDILQTGPWGLGVLRAAPALGALVTTVVLARQPIARRVGLRMFQAVIIYGLGTVVFSLSHWLWLSVVAMAVLGAADTVSVVIRFSLVQLSTPNEMRGRVGAVNFLFINASNNLGQFESGVTAALLGTMPAAVLGGVATVAIALLWMKLFPTLRDVEKLE